MPATATTSDCLSVNELHRLTERQGDPDQLLAWAAHLAYCPHCAGATASLKLEPAVLEAVEDLDGRSSRLFSVLQNRLKAEPSPDVASNNFLTQNATPPAPVRLPTPPPTTDPPSRSQFVSLERLLEPLPGVGGGKKDAPSHPPVKPHSSVPFAKVGTMVEEATYRPPPLKLPASEPPVSTRLMQQLAPAQGPDELGRLGAYRVLKVLGAGAVGVVFQAEDLHLKRQVALKLLHPNDCQDPVARERFIREGRAIAQLDHPNVVSVYQVGEDRGIPFLAMQLLQGETLDCRLEREKRINVAETLRIGREIALGLGAAHDRGMVHRDVKPANVWLEARTGQVKLLDFGLARAASDETQLTKTGMVVGTPAFMSPEQAKGAGLDQRSDLYSLGCVLYMMCAGVPPITAPDTLAMLLALSTEQPRPLQSLNPDVPPPLVGLINRLLVKHPQARVGSAYDVVKTLETIEKILPRFLLPGTARLSWSEHEKQQKKSSKAVGALLWSIIVLSIGFIAFLMLAPEPWRRALGNTVQQIIGK